MAESNNPLNLPSYNLYRLILNNSQTMHKAPMSDIDKSAAQQRTPDQLLLEIRNLITPTQKETIRKNLNSEQIEQILKASFDNYKKIQQQNGKSHLKQRARQAISIVQVNHPQHFVQQYTKHKVFSQMFFNLRGPFSAEESRSYELQRQELLKQRQLQQEQQRKRESEAIVSRKKFIKYESNELPFETIGELTMKEGESSRHYLINQSAQNHQNSANNLIKSEGEQRELEIKFQQMKQGIVKNSSSVKLLKDGDEEFFQIVDQSIDQSTYKQQYQSNITETLKKCPKVYETLKHILKKAMAYQTYIKQNKADRNNRNSIIRSSGSFKYTGETFSFNKVNGSNIMNSVVEITKMYNSKGVVLHEAHGKSILKQQIIICEKSVSKMKGQSVDFHAKKVRLTQDEISWCQQDEQFKDDSKKILLIVQQIKIANSYKEEGSFFSSNKKQVEIVHVLGKKRDFKFQLNFMEGRELYKQLCLLMAKKVIQLNTVIKHKLNPLLIEFVNKQDSTTFSLASSPLEDYQKYPDKQYRLIIISILTALFPWRKNVNYLNLMGVKFNLLQTTLVIKSINFLSKLSRIQISQTKFNQNSFTILMKHISQLECQSIDFTISECFIDDDLLNKVKQSFVLCTNIQKLNMSKNYITTQGFGVLLDFAEQKECKIKQLNINSCKIMNLISLGTFIKRAKRLQIIYAEQCGFNFSNKEELSSFFHCLQYRKIKKISLLGNDVVSDLHLFQQLWISDNVEQLAIDVGTFAEKTSKHLQGKIIS